MISGFDPVKGVRIDNDIYVILNQWVEPLNFVLPPLYGEAWYRVVDTAQPYPYDFLDEPQRVEGYYTAQPRSSVILISQSE